MIYLQDPDVTLYHGDCLEVLRTLPDRSVHMCATSPPFYGLRDYGTGTWEGGDEGCDHKESGTRHEADVVKSSPNTALLDFGLERAQVPAYSVDVRQVRCPPHRPPDRPRGIPRRMGSAAGGGVSGSAPGAAR